MVESAGIEVEEPQAPPARVTGRATVLLDNEGCRWSFVLTQVAALPDSIRVVVSTGTRRQA